MSLRHIWWALALVGLSARGAEPPGRLLWADEFSGARGTKPDPTKWTFDLGGGGWGNQELETYTNRTENAFVDGDGHLVIRAIRGAAGFTSARIKTQGRFSFKYGRLEARLKLPRGQGLWPAFWVLGDEIADLGWPACGEIDVMENVGREPAIVHGTVHGPGYSGKLGITAEYTLPGAPALFNDFHVYAVDWSPARIVFSIDAHAFATVTPDSLPHSAKWVFDHNVFVILNLAVGGGWPGNPDQSTAFPQDYTIDYVRIYAPRIPE